MAILKQDQVIFYHPFDDLQEFTTNETWSGSGVFQSAKINYGVTSEHGTMSQGNNTIYADTTVDATSSRLDGIVLGDGITVVSAYIDKTTTSGILKLGTISGATINYESAEFDFVNNTNSCALIPLNNTKFVVAYADNDQAYRGFTRVGTVSGSSISLGCAYQFTLSNDRGNVRSDTVRKIDNEHILLAHEGQFGRDGFAVVMHVSGDVLTSGNIVKFFDNIYNVNSAMTDMISTDVFDSTHVAIAYGSGNVDVVKTIVGTLSGDLGNELSFGDPVSLTPPGGIGIIRALTDTKAVLLYSAEAGDESESAVYVGQLSGTTIDWGAAQSGETTTPSIVRLNEKQCLVYSKRLLVSTSDQRVAILNIDDDNSISWSNPFIFDVFASMNNSLLLPFKGNGGSNVLTYPTTTFSGVVKLLFTDSILDVQSSGGDTYPSTSGDDRFAICFWSKELNSNNAILDVDFDYRVGITPSSIKLGSGTSEWNSSGVQSLLGSSGLNDENEHFLVLDFENTSGNNWQLNTSLDGAPFVDRGEQDVGSQALINNANPVPAVTLSSGSNGQWLDELVVWGGTSGTLPKFTDPELLNLYNLAEVSGLSMDQYAADDFSASGDLVVLGKDVKSDSLDLLVASLDVVNDSADLFIHGRTSFNDDINLAIVGLITINDNANLSINGRSPIDDNLELFIHGRNTTNDNIDLVVNGFTVVNDNVSLSILAKDIKNDSLNLFLGGIDIIDDNINLFINGPVFSSDDIGVFILGNNVVNDSLNLLINGKTEKNDNLSLSVAGYDTLIDDLDIFIYGANSKNDDVFLYSEGLQTIYQGVDLFISSFDIISDDKDLIINGCNNVNDNLNLFMYGISGETDIIDLFINGVDVFNDSLSLFVNGKVEKNDSLSLSIAGHDILTNDLNISLCGENFKNRGIDLYINPFDITSTDFDTFITGFDPKADNINLFINGFAILNDNIDMLIFGDDVASDSLNLFTNGLNVINDNIYSFVRGIDTINDDIGLFIGGVDVVNGNVDLFVNGLAVSSDNMILSTMGKDVENSFSDLFIYGSDVINDNVNLFANGLSILNDNVDVSVFGVDVVNDFLNLSVDGLNIINDNIDLFIGGLAILNDNVNLSIFSNEIKNDSSSLFVNGLAAINDSAYLFINGLVGTNDNLDMFVSGSGIIAHSGSTDVFIEGEQALSQNIDLFVRGSGIIAHSGNINLFMDAIALNDSISLFIRAWEVSTGFDFPFNSLSRLSDHYPQLIGRLDGASSATIEVWDIIDGNNQPLILLSSACYRIGATNRFGWNTQNLPAITYGQNQLFYRMTGDNLETFDGELVLKTPESVSWFMPPNQGDYIRRL